MRSNYEAEMKRTIRHHWKLSAVFTGSLLLIPGHGKELTEAELLPGELYAEIFSVGCYNVRGSMRIYQVNKPGDPPEKEYPASSEDVALVRKDILPETAGTQLGLQTIVAGGIGFGSWQDRLCVTYEISAKHKDHPNSSFVVVCRVAGTKVNLTCGELIGPIYAAKEHVAVSDKRSSLFVCKTYVADSHCVDTWYRLSPTGEITTFRSHPYDFEDRSILRNWKS